jgi:hypothetical protein
VPLPSRVPSRWGSRYPKICTSLSPSAWRHIVNGSAVVAIGVGRRGVGRDNSTRRGLSRGTLVLKGAEKGWRSWTRPGVEAQPRRG